MKCVNFLLLLLCVRKPPPNMEESVWQKHIDLYLSEKHAKRAKINKENRKKNKCTSRHGSRSLAATRHEYVRHTHYDYFTYCSLYVWCFIFLSFLIFFTLYACVNIYIQFKKSKDHQYPSLIESFHDQRCKDGAWLSDEARVQYVSTVLFLFLFYFILIYLVF